MLLNINGDNLTGVDDGDNEQIKINSSFILKNITKIIFAITIHEAVDIKQDFGQVSNA